MDLTVLNRQRAQRIDAKGLRDFLDRLIRELPPGQADELAVCFVSDRRMREYQRRFRGRDSTTDVLSFPGDGVATPDGHLHLGDIVISVPTAARQARRVGHSLERELRILLLHGYLHLLGFDHERDTGQMRRLQRRLETRLLGTQRGRAGATA